MRGSVLNFLVVFVFLSCTTFHGEEETAVLPGKLHGDHIESIQDECFQLKLEKWFVLFDKFQSEGATMHEADRQAVLLAELESRTCIKRRTRGNSHELKTARK